MFGLDITIVAIFALAALSTAGLAYGVLFSRIEAAKKTESRMRRVQAAETDQGKAKAARDRMQELSKRRKSVQDSLKDLEKKQQEQTKRVATDALRFARNPSAGELLRGRMTVLGKDPVGEAKGIVLAQHDLLDEAGRLVFSCLTRSVFACRGENA